MLDHISALDTLRMTRGPKGFSADDRCTTRHEGTVPEILTTRKKVWTCTTVVAVDTFVSPSACRVRVGAQVLPAQGILSNAP